MTQNVKIEPFVPSPRASPAHPKKKCFIFRLAKAVENAVQKIWRSICSFFTQKPQSRQRSGNQAAHLSPAAAPTHLLPGHQKVVVPRPSATRHVESRRVRLVSAPSASLASPSEQAKADDPLFQLENTLVDVVEMILKVTCDDDSIKSLFSLLNNEPEAKKKPNKPGIEKPNKSEAEKPKPSNFLQLLIPKIVKILTKHGNQDCNLRELIRNAMVKTGTELFRNILKNFIDLLRKSEIEHAGSTPYKRLFNQLVMHIQDHTELVVRVEKGMQDEPTPPSETKTVERFAKELYKLLIPQADITIDVDGESITLKNMSGLVDLLKRVPEELLNLLKNAYNLPNGTMQKLEKCFHETCVEYIKKVPEEQIPESLRGIFPLFKLFSGRIEKNIQRKFSASDIAEIFPPEFIQYSLAILLADVLQPQGEKYLGLLLNFVFTKKEFDGLMVESVFPAIQELMACYLVESIVTKEGQTSIYAPLYDLDQNNTTDDNRTSVYKEIHSKLHKLWIKGNKYSLQEFEEFEHSMTPLTQAIEECFTENKKTLSLEQALSNFFESTFGGHKDSVISGTFEEYRQILDTLCFSIGNLGGNYTGPATQAVASWFNTTVNKELSNLLHPYQTSPRALAKIGTKALKKNFGSLEKVKKRLASKKGARKINTPEKLKKEIEKTARISYDLIMNSRTHDLMVNSRTDSPEGWQWTLARKAFSMARKAIPVITRQAFPVVVGRDPSHLTEVINTIYQKVLSKPSLLQNLFDQVQKTVANRLKEANSLILPSRTSVVAA